MEIGCTLTKCQRLSFCSVVFVKHCLRLLHFWGLIQLNSPRSLQTMTCLPLYRLDVLPWGHNAQMSHELYHMMLQKSNFLTLNLLRAHLECPVSDRPFTCSAPTLPVCLFRPLMHRSVEKVQVDAGVD